MRMSQDGIEIHFDEKRGYLELACEPDAFAAYREVARDHLKDFPQVALEKVIELKLTSQEQADFQFVSTSVAASQIPRQSARELL